ncbi:hypothetical protein ACWA5Z_08905 [Testudinibacter sp. P80/BLE/0925]|uniref:hypothetical protein n=1 Tax=Testudinibacter sp. TW-1 TaxID=3417757 RepID=UPI003D36C89E
MENMTAEYKKFRDEKVAKALEDCKNGRVVDSEEVYRSLIETALKAEKAGCLAA